MHFAMHWYLRDSLALVDALCDADVLRIRSHSLTHSWTRTYSADSEALVDALIDADVLADSLALAEALIDALVLAGPAGTLLKAL